MNRDRYDAVILAAGDFPTHPMPASLLDHQRVVCCDGAAEAFIASGRTPYTVVGDGDSLSEDTKSLVRFVHVKEQDTNDLSKAVAWTVKQHGEGRLASLAAGCGDVARIGERSKLKLAIIGATGKREDHTLGNISLLIDYMRRGIDAEMITDHGVFLPCHGTRTFTASGNRQEISIFNFTCTRLTGEGLDYPLRPFTDWWQGTLNYVNSPTFTVYADGDYLIFLSFSFRK